MKQKTLRVFEVDDFEKLVNIVENKYDLVKNRYFLLKEKNEKIESFLKEKNLAFIILGEEGFTPKKEISQSQNVIEKEIVKKVKSKAVIYDKIIRSGEEIKANDDLIFLKRINAGAKIYAEGNVLILDECEGYVECEGEFIMIRKNRGIVKFRGEDIGDVENLTLFYKNGKKVLI